MANSYGDLLLLDVTEALELLLCGDDTDEDGMMMIEPVDPINPFSDYLQQNLFVFEARLTWDQYQGLLDALKVAEKEISCEAPRVTVEWKFTCRILELLHVLAFLLKGTESETAGESAGTETKPKREQDAPPLQKSALSVKQASTLKHALQLVACFGVSPNLSPGVGIPLLNRGKHADHTDVMQKSVDDAALALTKGTSNPWRRVKLAASISTMAEYLNVPGLQSFFAGVYLNTALAALLELLHANPEHDKGSTHEPGDQSIVSDKCTVQKGACESSAINNTSVDMRTENSCQIQKTDLVSKTGKEALESTTERILYSAILNSFLSNIQGDHLIRELLVLQAGVPMPVKGPLSNTKVTSPPFWLRKACGLLLQRLVLAPNGIFNLYSAVTAESNSPAKRKQCGVVARIMERLPIPVAKVDDYLSAVSQQLICLLNTRGEDENDLTHLACAVASSLSAKYKEPFNRHFHQRLQKPLLKCLKEHEDNAEGTVVVSEEVLAKHLEYIHKMYIGGQQPQASILCYLKPVVPVLWTLFCVTRTSVYSIKQNVKDIMVSYLKFLSPNEAAACLRDVCTSQTAVGDSPCLVTVRFEGGMGGGLQAGGAERERVTKLGDTQQVEAVIDILHSLKKDGVAGELLVILLKELTEMISKEMQQPAVILPLSMERSEDRVRRSRELVKRVTLLHLLAAICETFGSECLTDNTQILLFVKTSLERGVAVCRETSEAEMAIFETETMSMAMGLLTAVMAGAIKMEDKHISLLDEMLPLLEVIGQGHPDEFIQEMASDIRIAIATRGAVWSSLQDSKKREKKSSKRENPKSTDQEVNIQVNKEKPASKPLIQVLSDQPAPVSPDKPLTKEFHPTQPSSLSHKAPLKVVEKLPLPIPTADTTSESNVAPHPSHSKESQKDDRSTSISAKSASKENDTFSRKSAPVSAHIERLADATDAFHKQPGKVSLQTVFEELCDPLLPVRGHALISLAKLVEERDSETLGKKDVVQKVFEENIRHGDSYLYLASIRGLSALSNSFPESVVLFLAAEFAGFSKTTAASFTTEQRLKVGEALMKATRNLGGTIPKYREVLLVAALTGARDKNATVRASSVSILAEICSMLHFSLGPILQEVLNCCRSLLETDEVIIRQAASLTLAKLLEGLDRDALTVLEDVMKDLYRLLKKVHSTDTDEAVRLHANMALVHLDTLTRQFLFPKQSLQKKIQVLSDADTFK